MSASGLSVNSFGWPFTSSRIFWPSQETSTPCCHSNAPFLSISRKSSSAAGSDPAGGRIPCSVTNDRSDVVATDG